MAKRLAILENVSFAVIPQPPYASEINELLRGCITLMSNAADRDSDQFGIKMSAGRDLSLAGPMP